MRGKYWKSCTQNFSSVRNIFESMSKHTSWNRWKFHQMIRRSARRSFQSVGALFAAVSVGIPNFIFGLPLIRRSRELCGVLRWSSRYRNSAAGIDATAVRRTGNFPGLCVWKRGIKIPSHANVKTQLSPNEISSKYSRALVAVFWGITGNDESRIDKTRRARASSLIGGDRGRRCCRAAFVR